MVGHYVVTGGSAADAGRLGVWTDRLDAFCAALDAIDADDPFDYCAEAWEIWQGAAAADPPPATDPSVLVVLGALQALAHAMTSATLDYYRTADPRDRMTISDVHTSLTRCLGTLRRTCDQWLQDACPPADEINTRAIALAASLQASGARPTVEAGIMFDKVCALTDSENKRYREAYDRLRTMVNRDLLQHITDQSDTLADVVTGIVLDLQTSHGSTFDEGVTEERRRTIAAALARVTDALHDHREKSICNAAKAFGHNSTQVDAVSALFDDLTRSSLDYRRLDDLHHCIQLDGVGALRFEFTGRRFAERHVDVRLDRRRMTESEVTGMTRDPSVLDMIKAIRPKMFALQEQIDAIMYPTVAEDVAAVKELVGRFSGQKGLEALKSAPGATHEAWAPPHLSPRVLSFVRAFDEPR